MFKRIIFFALFLPIIVKAQETSKVIHLWENGAPGFEHLKNEKEEAKEYWVKNVHNPSITVYAPEDGKANGVGVLIFPGGGHRLLVIDAEGTDAAKFLNQYGITAFVLKYRMAREPDSPYELGVHAKEDAQRAMRLIRANAKEFGVHEALIGVMGFSAGGEVMHWMAYEDGNTVMNKVDEIDNENAKPTFQIGIYPGPLGVPETIPTDAPPAFVLAANDDECCSEPVFKLLQGYRKAGVPIEAHFYNEGGHGFNMGYRSELNAISKWPDRLGDWLVDTGLGAEKK
ncbi:alpha/beta hydrolase [Arcticibacterium luteifluviistationis]|uniref:1,4-beta-xylanase n=1 Tax=Arcticibacterium luteifluviistationis TaxID=1784714 RepID=A0A2Z4GD17_9BACT|nr:alpha/beta hydrolase [Arcticibacterium luteifluviistationis]AWV99007.1 1,4-beta-xylanase [Arcticibacterium luteifluviistationis]